MNQEPKEITVQIKYENVENTFSGSLEEIWLSINRFFDEFMPSFEIAKKLTLGVDLQKLVSDCQNIVGFTDEGSYLLVPRNKLTDIETLELLLLANHVGYRIGKVKSDTISKEVLQTKLGKIAKITNTRLGELVKSDLAAKTEDEKYRITTFGVVQLQKSVLPKIRTKLGI